MPHRRCLKRMNEGFNKKQGQVAFEILVVETLLKSEEVGHFLSHRSREVMVSLFLGLSLL